MVNQLAASMMTALDALAMAAVGMANGVNSLSGNVATETFLMDSSHEQQFTCGNRGCRTRIVAGTYSFAN